MISVSLDVLQIAVSITVATTPRARLLRERSRSQPVFALSSSALTSSPLVRWHHMVTCEVWGNDFEIAFQAITAGRTPNKSS
jgi:hypothetical protein